MATGANDASQMRCRKRTTGRQSSVQIQYDACSKPQGYGLNAEMGKKETHKSIVRVAERPGQTINIDLLFVPMQHKIEEKLPAVSGSSGRLVVERTKAEKEVACWPGLVFANGQLDYQEAMEQYAAETRDRLERRK